MYLPLGLSLPILVGGILEGLARGRRQAAGPGAESGVLFASGAVAGEALVGVGLALLVALGFERMEWGGAWQGLGAVLAALVLLAAFGRAVRADRVA
jgi:uncharacterized oligopeptide transporter (OPT) family protein